MYSCFLQTNCVAQNTSTLKCGLQASTTSNGSSICDLTGYVPNLDLAFIPILPEVDIYYIPVVVHVIHQGGAERLLETEVEGLIEELNYNFRGIDIEGFDTKIEFILAKVDEHGRCTNGITYNLSPLTEVIANGVNQPNPLADVAYWTPGYLNIWVVKNIIVLGLSDVKGYSSIPFSPPFTENSQGVVIEYDAPATTLTHEVGHFLGLLHVWGCNELDTDEICLNDCGGSETLSEIRNDFVIDTNPAISAGSDWTDCNPSFEYTCYSSSCPNDMNDSYDELAYPKENFMSTETSMCHNTFTGGQAERMYFYLNTVFKNLWYPGYIIKKEMIVDKETKFHRDVNIYAGGRLVLEAEAIMAEGTKIIVHEGGQLVVNGGKIRACGLSEPGGDKRSTWDGIHVEGTNADGFNVEMLLATIEDVDGYAIHVENSDVQMQNGNINIVRSTFNNVKGLAEFKKSIGADNSNSIIDECIQNGGVMGVNSLNCNGIQITNSKFFDIENICVATTGGSYLIEANEFHSDNIDIALTHLFPGEPSTITDGNEFRGDLYGIRASGATIDNHLIEGNIFYGQEFDPDVPISYYDRDIYMDGITDYSIVDNEFYGLVGVSSRATLNTNDISQFENNVTSNEFKRNLTGIYPHASNPNYYFSDNCFYTRYIDAQIEGAMANQGEEGGIPPNNCFTNQGVPSAGYTVVDIGGSPDVFDYVEKELDEVDCRHALLAPQVGVNILFTSQGEDVNCNGRGRERPFNSEIANLNTLLYDQLDGIGNYISQGDFDASMSILNQIDQSTEEGSDAYYITVKAIEAVENNGFVQDLDMVKQSLEVIAMKGHPSSGYAQALYYFLTNEFVDNLDLSFLETTNIGERSDGQIEWVNNEGRINIFPNPASGVINVSNSVLIENLKIYNTLGRLMFDGKARNQFNSRTWDNGIYIFKITKVSGEKITKKIVVSK